MYNDTITLFNFHAGTDAWYPTVLRGVDLGATKASSASRQGEANEDTVNVLVRSTAQKEILTDGGVKSFLAGKEYAHCDVPEEHITFQPECDFLLEGTWHDTIPLPDGEYEAGLYDALNAQRDGVYRITSAAFFGLLPHFEIGGR